MDDNERRSISRYPSPEPIQLVLPHIQVSELSGGSLPLLMTPGLPSIANSSPIETPKSPEKILSISTSFYPNARHNRKPVDLVLLSSDNVRFYVNTELLLKASYSSFNSLLPATPLEENEIGPLISLPESASVLNIVLHVIYGMTCVQYSPAFDDIEAAVHSLVGYGVTIQDRIVPMTWFYDLVLSHAPVRPLDVYSLAASYNLDDLAIATSSHLLSLLLFTLTDEMSEKIGPIYVKRLFFLHLGRLDALKRLLGSPPHPHPPEPLCSFELQKKLSRAWSLAAAYLIWDGKPDMSPGLIEAALNPLGESLTCKSCQAVLKERIKQLIEQWSSVKTTI